MQAERRRVAAYLRRWAADSAIAGGSQAKLIAITLETAADFIEAGAHDRERANGAATEPQQPAHRDKRQRGTHLHVG
jgi:hypothetical protein